MHNEPMDRIGQAARLDRLGEDIRIQRTGPDAGFYLRETLAANLASLLQGGSSVLLTGASGAGKTTLVRSLVAHEWAPPAEFGQLKLLEVRNISAPMIVETTPARFIEGCYYAHELENKLSMVFDTARALSAILFIDAIEGLLGIGTSKSDPHNDVANLMIPHLEKGLLIIGATTPEGEVRLRTHNPRLFERLIVLQVPEPDDYESLQIARLKVESLATPGVTVDRAFISQGLELVARYMPGRTRVSAFTRAAKRAAAVDKQVDATAVRRALATEMGVRLCYVGAAPPLTTDELQSTMGEDVFGQADAVREVAASLTRFSVGLTERNRPLATYLLAGPTGTGKTSLALATAEALTDSRDSVLRFDMSEYSDPYSVTRLLRDDEFSFAAQLLGKPAGVLLLDEIEKAHPSVVRMLLGALGEARLTGESGRTAHLDNYVVMMTTNVGARRWAYGMAPEKTTALVRADIAEAFPPEFLARMTRTVMFEPLSSEVGERIVRRELEQLNDLPGVVERGLQLVWADALPSAIARLGVSVERGARGVQQAVRALVTSPLACWMAEHHEAAGGIVMLAPRSSDGQLLSLSIDWVDDAGFFRGAVN